jgi:hypothetical protein
MFWNVWKRLIVHKTSNKCLIERHHTNHHSLDESRSSKNSMTLIRLMKYLKTKIIFFEQKQIDEINTNQSQLMKILSRLWNHIWSREWSSIEKIQRIKQHDSRFDECDWAIRCKKSETILSVAWNDAKESKILMFSRISCSKRRERYDIFWTKS